MDRDPHRAFASNIQRTVKRQMLLSVLVVGAIIAWGIALHAPWWFFAFQASMAAAILAFQWRAVGRARHAELEPSSSYRQTLRLSHRIRGTIFLVGCPLLVSFTWYKTFPELQAHPNPVMLGGLVAATVFLAGGMVWWIRALRAWQS